jgi:programmed cell death 6-interacting protein
MIVEEFTAAEKDNDLIYLLPIPAENELTLPTAAMMASPQLPPEIANPEEHLEKLGRQLFFDLAPAIVHEARLQYLKRRETLVETTIRRPLRELEKERES